MVRETNGGTEEVQALQQRWEVAELHADVATLAAMLANDFIAVGPFGFVLTKEEWLDRHRSGDLRYQAHAWEDVTIRRYGDTAIVVGALTQRATHKGNPVPGERLRVTQIAVREPDRWVIAGIHMSMIAPPPQR